MRCYHNIFLEFFVFVWLLISWLINLCLIMIISNCYLFSYIVDLYPSERVNELEKKVLHGVTFGADWKLFASRASLKYFDRETHIKKSDVRQVEIICRFDFLPFFLLSFLLSFLYNFFSSTLIGLQISNLCFLYSLSFTSFLFSL